MSCFYPAMFMLLSWHACVVLNLHLCCVMSGRVDMLHHDCYHDGSSPGSVLGGLRRLPRHSCAAQSSLVLQTVAWLCRDPNGLAHLSISVVCWCSASYLLGSVPSPLLFCTSVSSQLTASHEHCISVHRPYVRNQKFNVTFASLSEILLFLH